MSGEVKVSRREYLKAVAGTIAGLVIGGLVGYFAKRAQVIEKTVEQTLTVTSTVTVTPTVTPSPTPTPSPVVTWPPWKPELKKPEVPLKWVHWGYRPDIIADNIRLFCEQNNENLIQEQLTGDYQPLVESKFMAGEVFDMVYGNAFMAFRWVELGWTIPAEELPHIEWIKADMFESVKEAYSDAKGRLAGLTYFVSATPCLIANDELLEKAGMAGEYPRTHDELYESCYKLKEKAPTGMKAPLVPQWFNAFWGTVWSLLAEVAGRAKDPDLTKTMWGKDFMATFDAAPGDVVYETVKTWEKVSRDSLIEKAVISAGTDVAGTEAFWTGQYAFGRLNGLYGYWNTMDPAKSKIAGKATLVPVTEEAWGVIDTGLYCWPNKHTQYDRTVRLIEWFGYKDNYGRYWTAKRWAMEEFLHTAYPAVLRDPEVLDAWRKRLGPKTEETAKASEKWLATMARPWIWRSPLYGEWMIKAPDYLAKVLAGEMDAKTAVSEMRKLSDELWKKYHGS